MAYSCQCQARRCYCCRTGAHGHSPAKLLGLPRKFLEISNKKPTPAVPKAKRSADHAWRERLHRCWSQHVLHLAPLLLQRRSIDKWSENQSIVKLNWSKDNWSSNRWKINRLLIWSAKMATMNQDQSIISRLISSIGHFDQSMADQSMDYWSMITGHDQYVDQSTDWPLTPPTFLAFAKKPGRWLSCKCFRGLKFERPSEMFGPHWVCCPGWSPWPTRCRCWWSAWSSWGHNCLWV